MWLHAMQLQSQGNLSPTLFERLSLLQQQNNPLTNYLWCLPTLPSITSLFDHHYIHSLKMVVCFNTIELASMFFGNYLSV